MPVLVERAHHHGLKVMAHANSAEAVRIGINAGVDSIEHGYFLEPEQLDRMAETGIAWIPTIVPLYVRSGDRNVVRRTCERQIAMLRRAVDAGVRLGVGTDSGAPEVEHGSALHAEMALYAEG